MKPCQQRFTLLQGRHGGLHLAEEELTFAGQGNPAPGTNEKPGVQAFLKLADGLRNGRLGDVQLPRGCGEGGTTCGFVKDPVGIETVFHISTPYYSS